MTVTKPTLVNTYDQKPLKVYDKVLVKVYYIHSSDFKDQSKFENKFGDIDLKKVKKHSEVQEFELPDFIYALNVGDIDNLGVFAYEIVGGK